MLLIERTPQVSTTRMDCQGVWPSGTTFVEFNDTRWGFVVQSNRFSRVLVAESFAYASRRATFGKKLQEHPVIRWKLAEMVRQVEATHAWLEQTTFLMCTMPAQEAMTQLGGPCALMKEHPVI